MAARTIPVDTIEPAIRRLTSRGVEIEPADRHPAAYLHDIRSHLAELERRNLLVRVKTPVNKDTEMHPLVRLQFRGLAPDQRKGFLFENVTDARGRRFETAVAVGVMAGGPNVYKAGLRVDTDEQVLASWDRGLKNPIPPILVETAPVQEVQVFGDDLIGEGKGLDAIPIPLSTPGFDPAPYLTAAHWHTKDPETGILNVGNYRGMVKSQPISAQRKLANSRHSERAGIPEISPRRLRQSRRKASCVP